MIIYDAIVLTIQVTSLLVHTREHISFSQKNIRINSRIFRWLGTFLRWNFHVDKRSIFVNDAISKLILNFNKFVFFSLSLSLFSYSTSGVPPYARILRFNSPNFNGGGLISDAGWIILLSRRRFDRDFLIRSVSANKINGPRLIHEQIQSCLLDSMSYFVEYVFGTWVN